MITAVFLVVFVGWLVVVMELRHRHTRREGRDPWAEVGPRHDEHRLPPTTDVGKHRPGSVSAVGSVPPAPTGTDPRDGDHRRVTLAA